MATVATDSPALSSDTSPLVAPAILSPAKVPKLISENHDRLAEYIKVGRASACHGERPMGARPNAGGNTQVLMPF
jgi:hypothetical protein